jgi:hypothetical protein
MKRNGLLQLAVAVLCALLFSSCRKDPLKGLSEDESRIYITNYDTAVKFSNYKTFRIADSVAIISNNSAIRKEKTPADSLYIAAVTQALQQRGYIKVNRDQNPDLGVTVSRISNTYTQVVSYVDYDVYYATYWDPFYWGYPGYIYYFPVYYGVYNISETAIAIDIVDLKNGKQNKQLKDIWSGLIRGSGVGNPATIQNQVMQLFDQSPYFRAQ